MGRKLGNLFKSPRRFLSLFEISFEGFFVKELCEIFLLRISKTVLKRFLIDVTKTNKELDIPYLANNK